MEFSTICRVCMQPISLEYIDLDTPFNEITYFECFNYCTKLDAKASDKLPKSICHSCGNLMQMAYDFINAASEADRLFRECFAQLDDDSEVDIKFITDEDEITSKDIVICPSFSLQNKIFVGETGPTEHKDLVNDNRLKVVDNGESLEDKEQQEDAIQLTDEDLEQKENTQPTYFAQIVDVGNPTKLSLFKSTGDPIASELPVFQIVESETVDGEGEGEELQEDALLLTEDTKTEDNLQLYDSLQLNENTDEDIEIMDQDVEIVVVDKENDLNLIMPTEDSIESEFRIKEKSTDEEEQLIDIVDVNNKSEDPAEINEDAQPQTRCPICYKKVRKNYSDHMNKHTGNKAYKCDKCDEAFCTFIEIRRHKALLHKKFRDPWFCNMCGEAFGYEEELKMHQENDHTDNVPYGLCITCGGSFPDEEILKVHVKDEHYSRRCPVECTHCRRKYQLNTLGRHVEYAHSEVVLNSKDKEFKCKYCFENCEEPGLLEEHIRSHIGKNYFLCVTCGIELKGKRAFDEHKATMHRTQNKAPDVKKCNKCDFTSNDYTQMAKHKKKHYYYQYERTSKYLCAYCPKKFFNIKPLHDHEDYKHGEQKSAFTCDLCGKKFFSKFKLKNHKKSRHEDYRPFMCKECPKAFKLRAQLLQHEKIHYGRKIDCPHCDKKFVHQCYLRVHLRTHTNELPFECHLCDRKFAIKVRLTYHLAKHQGIVRKCEYCPEEFPTMAKLRIHRFEHTGYPYKCDICQEDHHKRVSFIRHMKRDHGIELSDADVEDNRLRNMKNIYRKNKVDAEPDLEI